MKQRELLPTGASSMSIRFARFEDVSGMLRLIERAIEHGCRDDYDERQRRSVYLGYASSLFIEALAPFETLVAEMGGRLVGATQIDPRTGLLRALFVDAGFQGQGVGHALLVAIESRARAAHCERLCGAMSLNAVGFYQRAGFRAQGGPAQARWHLCRCTGRTAGQPAWRENPHAWRSCEDRLGHGLSAPHAPALPGAFVDARRSRFWCTVIQGHRIAESMTSFTSRLASQASAQ